MGSKYLTSLADWLRQGSLPVTELSGWQTRARSSGGYDGNRPWAVMLHHTASPPSWNGSKDANYIATGDPDAPLANLYIDRQGNVWVCAAGATNTNGKGGPQAYSRGTVPLDSMNSYAVGIEMGNNGVGESWPKVQIDAMFKVCNILTAQLGLASTDVGTHYSWAPTRKIDPATAAAVQGSWKPRSCTSSGTWHLDDVRSEAKRRATPPPEDDVQVIELRIVEADAVFLAYKVGNFILWAEWVNGNDPMQLQRLQAYRDSGAPPYTMSVQNMSGVGLLGPIPSGDRRWNWSRANFGNVIT